jgi:hypothetical protein
VDITATEPKPLFIGRRDAWDDGPFAYIWQDDAMQVAECCFVPECVFWAIQPHSFCPPVLQSSSPPPCAPDYLPHCHTATLTPSDPHEPQSNKKRRIGNNYAIVYNESGHPYTMGTVKGQFIYTVIVVEPLDFESKR